MKFKIVIVVLLLAIALPYSVYADTGSISIGELLKKIITNKNAGSANTNDNTSVDSTLGINGFKSINEVKQFLQNAGYQMNDGSLDVKDSAAFDGFYALMFATNDGRWLPKGMLFSKTENSILFTKSLSDNQQKPALFEVLNQKLNPTSGDVKAFIKKKMLTKIRQEQLINISFKSIAPTVFVLSASDCSYCQKLEKNLFKNKISHIVLPVHSKLVSNSDIQSGKNNIAMACNGEKVWLDKMVNNLPIKTLNQCEEKSTYDMAILEIDDVLYSINPVTGFPTTILVREDESAIITGYSDAIPKLINRNNLGQSVNLNEVK